MARPHGWGRRLGFSAPPACLAIAVAGLALGGSALGAGHTISTIAGNGSQGFDGDGGAAVDAALNAPESVAATLDGGYLIADKENNRIRRVSPDGTIRTVAGTGSAGFNGDGLAATSAMLNKPQGVAPLLDGGFLIADTENNRVRRVSPLGTIQTVAGTGSPGDAGDGGLAVMAELQKPRGVAPLLDGGFLIADTDNRVVRRVSVLGTIATVAGNGSAGSGGDGGPATAATLGLPDDVAPTVEGGFLIADYEMGVVRKVSLLGTISTVAGGGSSGSDEDDSATDVELLEPADVEPLATGGFLVADHGTDLVQQVRGDSSIARVAGDGDSGFDGDGGPAVDAELDGPHSLSLTPAGDLLIADGHNNRVRLVDASYPVPAGGHLDPGGTADPSPKGDDPPTDPPASEPKLGERVVVAPAFGMVKVKRRGQRRWTLLERGAEVPVGSFVNTKRGSVLLTSALEGEGRSQTATFWGGVFQIRQSAKGNGSIDILLRGLGFRRCRAGRARAKRPGIRAVSSRRRRPIRRLWARDDNGRFRTHGRDSVATTRGTVWLTEDRCKGTVTRVKEGEVLVRHRHSRRRVLVGAGERYLAPRRP